LYLEYLEKSCIVHGRDHPEVIETGNVLLSLYYSRGEFDKADIVKRNYLKSKGETRNGEEESLMMRGWRSGGIDGASGDDDILY
jgi:lipopolysaccharide biosynthesis regulator YciM